MLSARVVEESNTTKLRKQAAKDKPPKKATDNGKDGSLSPARQSQLRAQQLALVREMEMNWYLKLCDLSFEGTTAYITGMPHR